MTRADLQSKLVAAGIPAVVANYALLLDNEYEPVSEQRVRVIANACLDALPDGLVTGRQVGGGMSIRVPRWVPEAGDCESHSLVLTAWAIIGNWLRAVRTGERRGGLALGPVFFTSEPRAENGYRAGRHSLLFFVDPEGAVRFFEFGDMAAAELTPTERLSITNLLAA